MAVIKGLLMSFSMFSVIPVPSLPWDEKEKRYIMLFFPLVGLVIGLLWYLVYAITLKLSLDTRLEAFIIMLMPFILSGFLHVDGFSDTCDACLSRRDLERKREILKDSHIGAFGVIALILLFMVNYISTLGYSQTLKAPFLLIFTPVLSRCTSGFFVFMLKSMHSSGLGSAFKSMRKKSDIYIMALYFILTLACIMLTGGQGALFTGFGILICQVLSVYFSYRSLDGFSGDLAGFSIVMAETCAVIMFNVWGGLN
ncbi:MAG: adenosylcobinamide-GDP ribazoletransferase [Clostridiales bacterium]|jgi:adenosylcobinamide-GDP ribazoletransferase|nr:adenosylcobinamide-GDP ribazoletransferase [Clostridiales bacterium]